MRRKISFILGIAWAVATVGGMYALSRYSTTPAAAAAAPNTWPEDDGPSFDSGKPTVLVFLHPKCPCSRTTIRELASVLDRCTRRPAVRVMMIRPDGVEPGWERTPLWDLAASVRGAAIESDADGAIARRFGAVASGQVLLYAVDGKLIFNGGITAGRGHGGDNPGRRALAAALQANDANDNGGSESVRSSEASPVFGCALFNAEQCVQSSEQAKPCP